MKSYAQLNKYSSHIYLILFLLCQNITNVLAQENSFFCVDSINLSLNRELYLDSLDKNYSFTKGYKDNLIFFDNRFIIMVDSLHRNTFKVFDCVPLSNDSIIKSVISPFSTKYYISNYPLLQDSIETETKRQVSFKNYFKSKEIVNVKINANKIYVIMYVGAPYFKAKYGKEDFNEIMMWDETVLCVFDNNLNLEKCYYIDLYDEKNIVYNLSSGFLTQNDYLYFPSLLVLTRDKKTSKKQNSVISKFQIKPNQVVKVADYSSFSNKNIASLVYKENIDFMEQMNMHNMGYETPYCFFNYKNDIYYSNGFEIKNFNSGELLFSPKPDLKRIISGFVITDQNLIVNFLNTTDNDVPEVHNKLKVYERKNLNTPVCELVLGKNDLFSNLIFDKEEISFIKYSSEKKINILKYSFK